MKKLITKYLNTPLVKNSAWGIISNILQVLLVSIFFAIVARKYSPNEFAQFLISTTVYQLVAAFSSMGLGQWFIRRYIAETDKIAFTSKFLKTQLGLGLLFYFVNIALAFLIYPDGQIRLLCIILGTNIIFDNFINAIKSLNIAEFQQRKTAIILVIDGFLKLLVGCLLFIGLFSTVNLSLLMIAVRVLTLSLFIKLGSSSSINLRSLFHAKISMDDLKNHILKNWQFIVIGSISIIYWKIANIIISKELNLVNVANYEISFRVFSVLLILPVVASGTIYPQFIKYYNEQNSRGLSKFYKNTFVLYSLFAVISSAFMYSFSGLIIQLLFGKGYPGAIACLQQMSLTFLILPTVLLQANLIVAIGLEKLDMWFNIISLLANVAGCLVGLYFFKEIAVVNFSVLLSFGIFHILQDIILIRRKLATLKHCLLFYAVLSLIVLSYYYLGLHIGAHILFLIFSFLLIGCCLAIFILTKRKQGPLSMLNADVSIK